MTNEEASNILRNTYENLLVSGGRACNKANLRTAILMGASALMALEQYRWECEIAMSQLEQLGIGFAEKIDGMYISRDEYNKLLEYKAMYEDLCK